MGKTPMMARAAARIHIPTARTGRNASLETEDKAGGDVTRSEGSFVSRRPGGSVIQGPLSQYCLGHKYY